MTIQATSTRMTSAYQQPSSTENNNCSICLEILTHSNKAHETVNFCPNGNHSLHGACMSTYLKNCQETAASYPLPKCPLCGDSGYMSIGQPIDINDSPATQTAKLLFTQKLNQWAHDMFISNNTMALFDIEMMDQARSQAGFLFVEMNLSTVSTSVPTQAQGYALEKKLAHGIKTALTNTQPNSRNVLDAINLITQITDINRSAKDALDQKITSALCTLSEGTKLTKDILENINEFIKATNSLKLMNIQESINMKNAIPTTL